MKLTDQITTMYTDFLNSGVTDKKFAENHSITVRELEAIIDAAKVINGIDRRAEHKALIEATVKKLGINDNNLALLTGISRSDISSVKKLRRGLSEKNVLKLQQLCL